MELRNVVIVLVVREGSTVLYATAQLANAGNVSRVLAWILRLVVASNAQIHSHSVMANINAPPAGKVANIATILMVSASYAMLNMALTQPLVFAIVVSLDGGAPVTPPVLPAIWPEAVQSAVIHREFVLLAQKECIFRATDVACAVKEREGKSALNVRTIPEEIAQNVLHQSSTMLIVPVECVFNK